MPAMRRHGDASVRCCGTDGVTPFSGNLNSTVVARITDERCAGGCTIAHHAINLLLRCGTAASPAKKPGMCMLKTTVNTELPGTVVAGMVVGFEEHFADFPPMPGVFVYDLPGNGLLATPGLYVP